MQSPDIRLFDTRPLEHPDRSVSELLRRDIDEFATEFRKTNRLLKLAQSGQVSRETIGRYLRSVHYLLRHTPIHLSFAEKRAEALGHDELAKYFAHKRFEEAGHDSWAEADIARLAHTFGVVAPREPANAMTAIVDANAKAIEQEPLMYLAYILFAEYFLVIIGPEWLTALAENCGVPRIVMTAIGNHVDLDRDHVKEGCGEIDTLADQSLAVRLRSTLQGVMQRFCAFCEELCDGQ